MTLGRHLSTRRLLRLFLLVSVLSPTGAMAQAPATPVAYAWQGETPPYSAATQEPFPAAFGAQVTEPKAHQGQGCCDDLCENTCKACGSYWFAGADYLLIRPQFSEAIAFSRGSQTAGGMSTRGEELDFSYDSSFRAFLGYALEGGSASIQFTYSHLQGEVEVDAASVAPGEFIVDPFGNGVGTIMVIDPHSALFGQFLATGDAITTFASVRTDVFDLDVVKSLEFAGTPWTWKASLGARLVDVEQYYESVITSGGSLFSHGDFEAAFIGAGPRLGFEGSRRMGERGQFAAFANAHVSLLVGQYDVAFRSLTTVPGPFQVVQDVSVARTIATVEAEIGASWQATDRLSFATGYMVQSWFDLGTSGGAFGGLFAGADDANIMAFDGMFLRAEVSY